jgi:glycosyltransferase involved in cell wall biosynthesis
MKKIFILMNDMNGGGAEKVLSLVVGEALILNKRIVSTDCCGMREALHDGKHGIIIKNSTYGLYRGLKSAICEQLKETTSPVHSETRRTLYDLRTFTEHITRIL